MLKTKLNMTVASALMVGGMVVAFSASTQAAPIEAGLQTIQPIGSGNVVPPGALPFAYSTLCMIDAIGDIGGCAKQYLTGSVNYNFASTSAVSFGANTFNGAPWTVHDVKFLGAGSYSNLLSVASYDMTVGANQLGATMLFDWGLGTGTVPTRNMRVIALWNIDDVSMPGYRKLIPVDADGDTWLGAAMVDTFTGQSPVFSIVTTVPVPAAAWLFGSGLLGLVGVARRRNKAAA
jgi:hypothetical protein